VAEHLFLGVDAGGTNSRARIRDASGRLVGEGKAGPGNIRLGAAAYTEIMKAVDLARTAANLDRAALGRVRAGFGVAGLQEHEASAALTGWAHPFASLSIDTDAYAACLGAFNGNDGAILILGTGSAGLAIVDGQRHSIGGWGADLGDDASGYAIGRLALRRSLLALEGMAERTRLTEAVLDRFDRNPPNMVSWASQATPGDVASFAPLVFDHAEEDDILAVAILQDAAQDAARLVNRLLAFGLPSVAMIGGLFPRLYPWLPEAVRAHLRHPAADALDGAIIMAQRQ
jgi:glucosamine kinase